MGCGVSGLAGPVTDVVLGGVTGNDAGVFKVTPDDIARMKSAASNGFIDHVLTTSNTDRRESVPDSGAEWIPEPPDGEMVDGMLGVATKEEIEKHRKSIRPGNPFCDSAFPASEKTLNHSGSARDETVVWLRPKDIIADPKLVVKQVKRNDVVQGRLGDCWFLSACAALCRRPELLEKVIPSGQVLYGEGYSGFLIFNFWRFGRWVTVYIDDRLPTVNGSLLYARTSPRSKEFWVPLLEKAYAKLHGSYDALCGGQSKDALVDLTGGIAESYPLETATIEFYKRLQRAHCNSAFITCSRKGEWESSNRADEKGLVSGHAYTVTYVASVPTQSGNYANLLRIRNPWANSSEWNGSWSDRSSRWKEIDQGIKKSLNVDASPDGEFWMSFQDFKKEFRDATVCTLGLNANSNNTLSKSQVSMVKSAWIAGKSCGGSRNNLHKFATNPQYRLTIADDEMYDDDEQVDLSGRRTVVVALMQEHRRSQNKFGLKLAHIAFIVYKGEERSDRKLSLEYFATNKELAMSGPHINFREVTARLHLVPGSYVIIPSTFENNCPRPFLIRVFCDRPFTLREMKGEAVRAWEKMPADTAKETTDTSHTYNDWFYSPPHQ